MSPRSTTFDNTSRQRQRQKAGTLELPRYGGHLTAFVVVEPVGAVVNGEGAPFSTTPQAGAAEVERTEPWVRHDHHIRWSFGNR
jgi:hypothetical protein